MGGLAAWAPTTTESAARDAQPDAWSSNLRETFAQARSAVRRDPTAAERWLDHLERLLANDAEPTGACEPAPIKTGGLAPWQVNRVQRHVEANIGGRLCTAELAAIARLSENHFARAFKNTLGAPPHAYVTERRIRHARKLILETDLPLSQVALEAGLADQAHLSRLFRRFFGGTPSACRRQNRWPDEICPVGAAQPR
jgi:transcriptional regulator GlxA family with amidase domain